MDESETVIDVSSDDDPPSPPRITFIPVYANSRTQIKSFPIEGQIQPKSISVQQSSRSQTKSFPIEDQTQPTSISVQQSSGAQTQSFAIEDQTQPKSMPVQQSSGAQTQSFAIEDQTQLKSMPVQQSSKARSPSFPIKEKTQPKSRPKKRMKTRPTPEHQDSEDLPRQAELQLEFLDHVVMIWLNRARHGDRRITMPDTILQAKAKQAARLLKYRPFFPNIWLHAFKIKLKQDCSPVVLEGRQSSSSMLIRDIIQEERSHFFNESNCSDSDVQLLEERPGTVTPDVPVLVCELSDSEEDIVGPIETYDGALDCLRLVEDYCLCVRNLMAVGLIVQIEELIRKHK